MHELYDRSVETQHAQHRNKITTKAKTYVKGKIFIALWNGAVWVQQWKWYKKFKPDSFDY